MAAAVTLASASALAPAQGQAQETLMNLTICRLPYQVWSKHGIPSYRVSKVALGSKSWAAQSTPCRRSAAPTPVPLRQRRTKLNLVNLIWRCRHTRTQRKVCLVLKIDLPSTEDLLQTPSGLEIMSLCTAFHRYKASNGSKQAPPHAHNTFVFDNGGRIGQWQQNRRPLNAGNGGSPL